MGSLDTGATSCSGESHSKKLLLFGFSFRYKLVDVAFLMHKLLQRVKVMKVAGELAREGNGGEGVQGGRKRG